MNPARDEFHIRLEMKDIRSAISMHVDLLFRPSGARSCVLLTQGSRPGLTSFTPLGLQHGNSYDSLSKRNVSEIVSDRETDSQSGRSDITHSGIGHITLESYDAVSFAMLQPLKGAEEGSPGRKAWVAIH